MNKVIFVTSRLSQKTMYENANKFVIAYHKTAPNKTKDRIIPVARWKIDRTEVNCGW